MKTVLALGSHIDDVEIGCGGSLIKHRDQGDIIHIAILKSDEDLTGFIDERRAEQRKSCHILKAHRIHLYTKAFYIEQIVKSLDEISPDILYFPFEHDTHQDHVFASKVGFAVSRNIGIMVLKYLGVTSHSYYPNYLSVIDMKAKKELVSIFDSQMSRKPKFMEIMEAQNRYFGSLVGNGYFAEGFILHRMVAF